MKKILLIVFLCTVPLSPIIFLLWQRFYNKKEPGLKK